MRLKIISAALALTVLFSSCAAPEQEQAENGGLKIISTVYASYDFAKQVAGGRAEVALLVPPGSESHSFEPTPKDMAEVEGCDLFIYVGGESDMWAEEIIGLIGGEGTASLKLTDCVSLLDEETAEGMEEPGEAKGEKGDFDEHVWTSPKNAELIVQGIAEKLRGLDPGSSGYYEDNAEGYIEQLEELDAEIREIVEDGSRRTLIFGDRFPLRYFAEEYGLDYYAAFPGCSSQTEPSAATLAFLIDKVREEDLPVVFYIELSNGLMADTICAETGAQKRLFNTCHNISRENFENGETYLSLMRANEEALREALG